MTASAFSYRCGKNGVVRIYRANRLAVTLKGGDARKFLDRVESTDATGAQRVMAAATRQFKFGNERQAKQKW